MNTARLSRGLLLTLAMLAGTSTLAAQGSVRPAESSNATDFALPPPGDEGNRQVIWSTAYIAYLADESAGGDGVPLVDKAGHGLGPTLSHVDWCHAAMEGTVTVRQGDAALRTFNAAGETGAPLTDCRDVFPHVAASVLAGTDRMAFAAVPADAPFGLGVAPFRLVPWRSIAVDPNVIPLGTVLFVPSLKGVAFKLPDGRAIQHDGYVVAVDRGGAIRGNHVDFFKGPTRDDTPPSGLGADENHTVSAFIVTVPAIVEQLLALHRRS